MRRLSSSWLLTGLFCLSVAGVKAASPCFGIQVVDEQTGRGVPLMELRTVSDIPFVTDSAGWVAFQEPGLMDREVFFHLTGPGYEQAKDGYGFAGIRVTPKAGETTIVKVKRLNLAERISRLTGQGIYRDSELLSLPCPVPNLSGGVTGQDSVQAVPYRGKIFWLWGDTNVASYALGNFQTSSASTPVDLQPERGIVYDYFMDAEKPTTLRRMMPLNAPGPVWLFGLLNVKDSAGREVLLSHYGRYKDLATLEEHGLARFDDQLGHFVKARELELKETWRFPRGVAVRVTDAEGDWFAFTDSFLQVRVRATLEDLMSPASYEALHFDEKAQSWSWQKEFPPTTPAEEARLLGSGKIKPELARYRLFDATSGKPVMLHRSSVRWNAWRQCWILIGTEQAGKGSPSHLGEIRYAESPSPYGPWKKSLKVASHPDYTFYNPVQHDFLDAEGGKVIYFEGTYTRQFSGNPTPTARYDYNQILYRLDLSDARFEVLR
jgi:hypothetical protein